MEAFEHTPGKRDFLIEEKDVSVTEFRRKPSAAWQYLEGNGHVNNLTRGMKCIATHMCFGNQA